MNRNFEPLTARAIVAASTHRQTASARVVVGIDDTPLDAFRQTLLVAAAEAVRRHSGVLLLHGCEPLLTATSLTPGTPAEQREAAGRQIVTSAAELVAQHLPEEWPIELCVDPGTGAGALEEVSEVAALIVLKRRSVSAIRRWHTGSTTSRVAGCAQCPVVVIRENQEPTPAGSAVVVGVDDRGHAGTAVDMAFAEADLRRTDLLAVHCMATTRPDQWVHPGRPRGVGRTEAKRPSRAGRGARRPRRALPRRLRSPPRGQRPGGRSAGPGLRRSGTSCGGPARRTSGRHDRPR